MTVISLKDYAEQKNVSYEAVRQQVVRYKDELEGHVIRDGRQQFLDEEAVAFLDGKRQKNPVTIIQQNKDERIEELEREKEAYLLKIAEQADRIAKLSEWMADNAVAIAEANQKQQLLEDKTKQLQEKDQLYQDAKKEADALHLKLREEQMCHKQELFAEQNRPLTLRERITGRKEVRGMKRKSLWENASDEDQGIARPSAEELEDMLNPNPTAEDKEE